MEKTKTYKNVVFCVDALEKLYDEFYKSLEKSEDIYFDLKANHDDSKMSYDKIEELQEFYADIKKYKKGYLFSVRKGNTFIYIDSNSNYSYVVVGSDNKYFICTIYNILEKYVEEDYIAPIPKPKLAPTVFIGHGGSSHWRDLKDHLQDKHHIKVEAYETGARAGHTIRDILDEMVNKSTFALLIMTGEDEQGNGQKRARQNVIHEIGLFQGKLGFNRAIVLMEHTTEEFSNIAGIQQIKYTNISETFGEVLATIKREFD
jgi:predicted nucleotide-binding protein